MLRRSIPWITVVLIAMGLWFAFSNRSRQTESTAEKDSRIIPAGKPRLRQDPISSGPPGTGLQDHQITTAIEACLAGFSQSNGPEESSAHLEALRSAIRSAPDPQAAASAIADFLKSGKDAPSSLPFSIGPQGVMNTSPSLRTALLDLLPSLDPTLALEVARSVMDHTDSADEYALGLRNLAWNDLNGDLKEELGIRFDQLLQSKDWMAKPSAGFLESFDAAVELSDEPHFSSMFQIGREALAGNNPPIARAAMMALDRMILRNPSLLVNAYERESGLSGLPPEQRASLLSRLDITEPSQRETFVRYLNATVHGSNELDDFSSLFPNGNYLHGHWLITTAESTHTIESRLAEDRKVLAELDRIAPEMQSNETILRIRERLTKLVDLD